MQKPTEKSIPAPDSRSVSDGEYTEAEKGIQEWEPTRARALLTLLGASLAVFTSIGFMNAFGVFQAYYSLGPLQDHSAFQISWIGSFGTFLTFIGAAPAGILADKFGPRLPMTIGAVCMLIGIFTTSVCKEYYQFFLAQGVTLGIGLGMVGIPTISAVAAAFKKNRSLSIGATVGGSSIGGLIWPVVVDQLINNDKISFGWTIRICGFIMLACLAVAIVTVPLSLPPKSHPAAAKAVASKKASPVELVKRPVVIVLCCAMAITYLGLFSPFFFISTYALEQGVSTSLAFYMVSILNGASLFGRLLAGAAADKLGAFNLSAASILASALICFCWTAATTPAGIIVFAAAYGFTSGAILSLQAACGAQLSTPDSYGTLIGIVMGASALTGLFGTPISGQLVAYGYLALSIYAGACILVGASLIITARLMQSRTLLAKV